MKSLKAKRNFMILLAFLQIVVVILCVIDVLYGEEKIWRMIIDCIIAIGLIVISVNKVRQCRAAGI